MTFKEFFARFRVIVVSKDKNNFPKHTLSPSRSKFRSNGEYLSIVTISSQMSICDVWRELKPFFFIGHVLDAKKAFYRFNVCNLDHPGHHQRHVLVTRAPSFAHFFKFFILLTRFMASGVEPG